MATVVKGSCHCGDVTFTLKQALPASAMSCNCSICQRKGYLLTFVTPDVFELETTREALAVYTFNKHVVQHQFCRRCGCAPFGEGTGPDGTKMVAINLRCIEGIDLSAIEVTPYDGASR